MKQTIGTARTAWVMLFFLLSAYLAGPGITSAFTRNIQNIEIDAESEGESKEEAEIHVFTSSQPSPPKKRPSRVVQATCSLLLFPKYNPVAQSDVLKSTRVITYRSLLL